MRQKLNLKIDHIGYAVSNIDKAKEIFKMLGYEIGDTQVDEFQDVNVCVIEMGGGICRIAFSERDQITDKQLP